MPFEQCPYLTVETGENSSGHYRCMEPAGHPQSVPHRPSLRLGERMPAILHWALPNEVFNTTTTQSPLPLPRTIQSTSTDAEVRPLKKMLEELPPGRVILRTTHDDPISVPSVWDLGSGAARPVFDSSLDHSQVAVLLGLPWRVVPYGTEQGQRFAVNTMHTPPRLFTLNEIRTGSLTDALQNAAFEDEERLVRCIVGAVNTCYLRGDK